MPANAGIQFFFNNFCPPRLGADEGNITVSGGSPLKRPPKTKTDTAAHRLPLHSRWGPLPEDSSRRPLDPPFGFAVSSR